MRKRTMIKVVAFLVCVCAICLSYAIAAQVENAKLSRYVQYSGEHALSELSSTVQAIDHALDKSLSSASGPYLCLLSAQIWNDAETAKGALSSLPVSDIALDKTNKLISQVGAYSYTLLKKSALGDSLSDEDLTSLTKLSEASKALSTHVEKLREELQHGQIPFRDISDTASKLREQDEQSPTENGPTTGFENIETALPELGTLIYDGPFSDHLLTAKPKYLEGKSEIDEAAAKKAAAKFLAVNEDELSLYSKGGDSVFVYSFKIDSASDEVSIDITKLGGYPASFVNSRKIAEATIAPEKAVLMAEEYLSKLGFSDMEESYYEKLGGKLVINFAYKEGEVIVYPDLVKVSVALDTGEVIGLEAGGYLSNHHPREITPGGYSKEAAQAGINKDLKVFHSGLALIPTDGKNEVLCYEFKCEMKDGRHCIVYVNTKTGAEENILMLIESENGTLTV